VLFGAPWFSARLVLERFIDPAGMRRSLRRAFPQRTDSAPTGGRQFLVDVSVLAHHDAGTGIQRVTKALLGELVTAPPEGYVVRTVQASRWQSYRYVGESSTSSKVQVRPGDIFLGLDLASRILPHHRFQLIRWRADGARLCFVLYDLLPLLHSSWFTRRNSCAYRAWIRTVAVHADSVICISQSVADQFRAWLSDQGFDLQSSPDVKWFHLGVPSAIGRRVASHNLIVPRIAQRPIILMVGTIEPRKGYALALDAFEAIWRADHPAQLVIVGRAGWKVDALLARLRGHPQAGQRLHWLDDADDDTLSALYSAASGVLVASEAEGFGLPILEAAAYGKPLLIRDLAVFREIAGDGATYFRATTPIELASELRDWLIDLHTGAANSSALIAVQDWRQSARQLLRSVLHPHEVVQ